MTDFEPANDETIISRRKNTPDDATIISTRRTQPVPVDADVDETVITSRRIEPQPPADDTVIVSRQKPGSEPDSDQTVIVSRSNIDETIITGRSEQDNDDTILVGGTGSSALGGSSSSSNSHDDISVDGGRSASAPEASVGSPVEFTRPSEPVVAKIERLDFGTPPQRTKQPSDPAAVYERAMKQSRRSARNLTLLLVASAVFVGVAIALAVVLLG